MIELGGFVGVVDQSGFSKNEPNVVNDSEIRSELCVS